MGTDARPCPSASAALSLSKNSQANRERRRQKAQRRRDTARRDRVGAPQHATAMLPPGTLAPRLRVRMAARHSLSGSSLRTKRCSGLFVHLWAKATDRGSTMRSHERPTKFRGKRSRNSSVPNSLSGASSKSLPRRRPWRMSARAFRWTWPSATQRCRPSAMPANRRLRRRLPSSWIIAPPDASSSKASPAPRPQTHARFC